MDHWVLNFDFDLGKKTWLFESWLLLGWLSWPQSVFGIRAVFYAPSASFPFRFPAALLCHLRRSDPRTLRGQLRKSRGPDHEAHEVQLCGATVVAPMIQALLRQLNWCGRRWHLFLFFDEKIWTNFIFTVVTQYARWQIFRAIFVCGYEKESRYYQPRWMVVEVEVEVKVEVEVEVEVVLLSSLSLSLFSSFLSL